LAIAKVAAPVIDADLQAGSRELWA
jgi:hypothetical protein